MIKYFSYGSNMSIKRIGKRIQNVNLISTACINLYKLRFHKKSSDGSAKADCFFSNNPADIIWGVVYEIPTEQVALLDEYEGFGKGYTKKTVSVKLKTGTTVETFTYIATRIDDALLPYDWYKLHVIYGAVEHALPESYIDEIRAIKDNVDGNIRRREEELSIYSQAELGMFGTKHI